MQRGVVAFEQIPLFRYLVEQLRYFSKKPPKGFEKYFEEGKAPKAASSEASAAGKEGAAGAKQTPKSSSTQQSPQKNEWNFGMFNNSSKQSGGGGRPGQGRPLGEGSGGDKEKWAIVGALVGVGIIASLAFFEMGYKEISWKDFVTR